MIHKKTEKECPECKEVFSYLECSEPHLCDTCTFPEKVAKEPENPGCLSCEHYKPVHDLRSVSMYCLHPGNVTRDIVNDFDKTWVNHGITMAAKDRNKNRDCKLFLGKIKNACLTQFTEPQPTSLIRRLSIFFGKIIKR